MYATGANNYLWTILNYSQVSTSVTFSAISQGNYTFSVSTSGSCGSSFETGNITVTTNPFGTTTVTNVSCFGAANGAADLTPSGGTAPYTFSWSNNATTEDISSVSAGNYFVTITDANGCNSTDSVTITEPVSGIVTAIQGTNVLCFGNSSGAADLTVSGGSLPYTFLWSNNALTEDISSISPDHIPLQ